MIIVDANLLINAVNDHAPDHRKSKAWLESVLSGKETVGLPWTVLLAFLRISTRIGIFPNRLSSEEALDIIDGWLAQPSVVIAEPGPRHARLLRDLLAPLGAGGNLTSDAHLAAIAIENGALLYSFDSDFARFPRLNWRNPLA